MTRSKPHRFPWIQSMLLITAAAAFACAPQPAWAGHGGGGGGGHVGGGGGGHFGGGAGASSGGSHASAPVHAYSSPAVQAPARPPVGASAFRRPAPRPGFYGGTSSGLPAGLAQFTGPQRFGGVAHPMPGGSPVAAPEPPRNVTIGFPPLAGNSLHEAPLHATQGVLSFSGEGHEIWQNSAGSPSIAAARPVELSGTVRRPAGEMARPIFPFRHHHRGSGEGFGFFGFPFLGLGLGFEPGCDAWAGPFWGWDWDQCNFFGYSSYFGPGYDSPSDYIQAPEMMDIQPAYGPDVWPPAYPSDSGSSDNSSAAPSTLLYMKDGTSYAITDYWLEGGQLHYLTSYGAENTVDLGLVDLQRTVDENAARGVNFTLRPGPEPESPAAAAPTEQAAPNAQPPANTQSAPASPASPR
jgi:hypothetical protein